MFISGFYPDSPISALRIAEIWLRLTNAERPEAVQVVLALCARGGSRFLQNQYTLSLFLILQNSWQGLRLPRPK